MLCDVRYSFLWSKHTGTENVCEYFLVICWSHCVSAGNDGNILNVLLACT